MSMSNKYTPRGTVVVSASATPVNFMGLTVLTTSDLTYVDSLGVTTTLTAVAAGITILVQVTKVTTCTGVVLGYVN
jgi:hypothetical protein